MVKAKIPNVLLTNTPPWGILNTQVLILWGVIFMDAMRDSEVNYGGSNI